MDEQTETSKLKQIDYRRLDELAKPKDRIKIGLLLMKLKKCFP